MLELKQPPTEPEDDCLQPPEEGGLNVYAKPSLDPIEGMLEVAGQRTVKIIRNPDLPFHHPEPHWSCRRRQGRDADPGPAVARDNNVQATRCDTAKP